MAKWKNEKLQIEELKKWKIETLTKLKIVKNIKIVTRIESNRKIGKPNICKIEKLQDYLNCKIEKLTFKTNFLSHFWKFRIAKKPVKIFFHTILLEGFFYILATKRANGNIFSGILCEKQNSPQTHLSYI